MAIFHNISLIEISCCKFCIYTHPVNSKLQHEIPIKSDSNGSLGCYLKFLKVVSMKMADLYQGFQGRIDGGLILYLEHLSANLAKLIFFFEDKLCNIKQRGCYLII